MKEDQLRKETNEHMNQIKNQINLLKDEIRKKENSNEYHFLGFSLKDFKLLNLVLVLAVIGKLLMNAKN